MKTFNPKAYKDRLRGHKQAVIAMYSPFGYEGHLLYSLSREGAVKGWDLVKRQIAIKCSLSRKVKTAEQLLQQQTQNDIIEKQDKQKKDKQTKIISNKEEILSACFTQKSVFSTYEDGSIYQWQFTNQSPILHQYIGHTKRISNLFVTNKKTLVSGSLDATIRTWNIQTGQSQAVYKTAGPVNHIIQGQNNEVYAIVSRNTFYQINIKTNSISRCIKFSKHSITSFICKDNILVFGNIDNKLMVYDLSTFDAQNPTKFAHKKMIQGLGGWILSMKFFEGYLYTGCDDRKLRVYKWPQIQQVQELVAHEDGVISIEFASKMLLTGSYDHYIKTWDIQQMIQRISERNFMLYQDVQSKKYEVYYNVVFKNKKKKLPAKKKQKKQQKKQKQKQKEKEKQKQKQK